jgi:shikimate dehydrogenase
MRTFGLIGYPLTHSFSKKYFTDKFQQEGLFDHSYENFPIETIQELEEVFRNNPSLQGLNITIPYKQQVLAYLDEQTAVVQETGACNCIKIVDGKKIGYNTDVIGFGKSLDKKLKPSHKKALVLGTGGAAKAVHYSLKQRRIEYLQVSRHSGQEGAITYEQVDPALLSEYTLIINTTPIGMFPHVEEAPPIPYEALSTAHYLFDLVYNPQKTRFLQKGEAMGAIIENGAAMLKIQADASWDIWNL